MCVHGCVYVCVRTPRRGSSRPTEQRREGEQEQSCRIFCLLYRTLFPPSLPFFRLFPPSFRCFQVSHPGARTGETALPCRGGTAAPGARSRPSGGGLRRRGRQRAISSSRAPSAQGWQRLFEGGACLPWQRSVMRPDLPLTPPHPAPSPPREKGERPLAPLFPFSVRACLC